MAKAIRPKVEESVQEMFQTEEGMRKIVESVVQVALNEEIERHLQARR